MRAAGHLIRQVAKGHDPSKQRRKSYRQCHAQGHRSRALAHQGAIQSDQPHGQGDDGCHHRRQNHRADDNGTGILEQPQRGQQHAEHQQHPKRRVETGALANLSEQLGKGVLAGMGEQRQWALAVEGNRLFPCGHIAQSDGLPILSRQGQWATRHQLAHQRCIMDLKLLGHEGFMIHSERKRRFAGQLQSFAAHQAHACGQRAAFSR